MAGASNLNEAMEALEKAKAEIARLEDMAKSAGAQMDAVDCTCDNPGCSGAEPLSYAAAVVGAFGGGVSS